MEGQTNKNINQEAQVQHVGHVLLEWSEQRAIEDKP